MADKLFNTVYLTHPRKCDLVRCRMPTWLAVKDFHFRTPEDAWRSTLDFAADVKASRPDPADHIILSGWLTDEQDERGAFTVRVNWEHTVDPQSLHDEIERERRQSEQQTEQAKEDRPPSSFQIDAARSRGETSA
jgi:hypothetical protein